MGGGGGGVDMNFFFFSHIDRMCFVPYLQLDRCFNIGGIERFWSLVKVLCSFNHSPGIRFHRAK